MADDEQFSLCWNNFNSNLSAGFHESLCRGDLVDVTLAAEGQFVKAHRLVLSVCSPYFRKMFTQMPANQHAFVFLKDVSHTALKDLIQFMYCGEVNVKQEALPAFISTAEALQIKGLTDSDPPQSQTPPEPSTPTPQIQSQQIQASPRVRHRTSTGRSYKIETVDDSGDDTKQTTQIVIQTTAPSHPPQATITTQAPQQQHHHHHHHQQQQQHQPPQQHIAQQPIQTQTHQLAGVSLPTSTATTAVVTHKRPAQRTNLGSVPHIKRSKSTIDPLEASDATVATQQLNVQTTVVTSDVTKSQSQQHHHHQQQQQTQSHHHQSQPQQTNEPEYIDMPMELPTKSEPDYVEDAGEVDQGEQDGTYVEDESYGDMRYDESYFTEGEEAGGAAGNAATGGATSTSATATTSKAIVKSQPLSDSAYMDSTGDQANSDAQGLYPGAEAPHGQYKGQNPKIQFSVSKRGGQLLWLDGLKYFRNNENRTNFFWRCHWYYRRVRCPVLICMNKYDISDFRQIHNHCHVKSGTKLKRKLMATPAAISGGATEERHDDTGEPEESPPNC
ncbi:modifier of mdg4 isoform X14 [Stomoxys calcitrans]|uniref:BTB domain-containing protein n=1 Tax=Stomoxys calcitrans TaxID=35570 RepID=A0A1I8PGR9_STOCA|nr:modifier of mdg4 isoform X14 [Stomoxys calcitrans]XP_013102011.1 modifier of mdg4 isoform X14 [Stomoxys calcitrans]XP_059220135.1 modifier of mdg4 isoform X14 [Stomoxys calcitrans]